MISGQHPWSSGSCEFKPQPATTAQGGIRRTVAPHAPLGTGGRAGWAWGSAVSRVHRVPSRVPALGEHAAQTRRHGPTQRRAAAFVHCHLQSGNDASLHGDEDDNHCRVDRDAALGRARAPHQEGALPRGCFRAQEGRREPEPLLCRREAGSERQKELVERTQGWGGGKPRLKMKQATAGSVTAAEGNLEFTPLHIKTRTQSSRRRGATMPYRTPATSTEESGSLRSERAAKAP